MVNPEDIELGDGVDEEEDAGGNDGDVKLQQKAVPVRHLPCMPPYVGLTSACRCLADDLLTLRPLPEACTHQAAAIACPLNLLHCLWCRMQCSGEQVWRRTLSQVVHWSASRKDGLRAEQSL